MSRRKQLELIQKHYKGSFVEISERWLEGVHVGYICVNSEPDHTSDIVGEFGGAHQYRTLEEWIAHHIPHHSNLISSIMKTMHLMWVSFIHLLKSMSVRNITRNNVDSFAGTR